MQTQEARKFSGKMARQGDVLFIRFDGEIPEKAREVKQIPGQCIVAKSVNGHHHLFRSQSANIRELDALTSYLTLSEPATLEHLRAVDPHAPIQFDAGTYLVRRPIEVTPEGLRRIED